MRWRDMTTPELLWLVHEERVEGLREHNPKKLRQYLIEIGDEETLRAHDKQMMSSGKRQ